MQRVPVMRYDREAKCKVQVTDDDGQGVWTSDSSGANRALELLGKHLGTFSDNINLTVTDNIATRMRETEKRETADAERGNNS